MLIIKHGSFTIRAELVTSNLWAVHISTTAIQIQPFRAAVETSKFMDLVEATKQLAKEVDAGELCNVQNN